MSTAYLGIGSNLGNRKEHCDKALSLLAEKGLKVLQRSSFYETEPWGIKEQPKFINMAAEIKTDLKPAELLEALKQVEIELGRKQIERWGPRVIDLDILFYNDLVINRPELEIPHPGIKNREFVLEPLCEIAPDKIHPIFNKTVKQLLERIRNNQ